jgi:Ran GTPase-activating protein (RanGAP) involved in mRNA processing and transport
MAHLSTEKLTKLCEQNERLCSLISLSQKDTGTNPTDTFLQLNFHGKDRSLENSDITDLITALEQADVVKALDISHQTTVTDLVPIAKFIAISRAFEILDVSYSNITDLQPLISAIGPPEETNTFEADKGQLTGQIVSLNLSGLEISVSTMNKLCAKLKKNDSLKALKLKATDLDIDSIVKLLDALNENQTLESLDLSRAHRVNNPVNVSIHLQRYFANNTQTISRLVLRNLSLNDQSIMNIVIGLLRSGNNLKHLDVACNKLSRDASHAITKLLNNNSKIESLDLSENRLENPGVCNILDSLQNNKTLKTLIVRFCEASEPSWLAALDIFESKNFSLREFFAWGNDYKGQAGATALKELISTKRFEGGTCIDLEAYTVDGSIYIAEDSVYALAAQRRFHWSVDKKASSFH